MIPRDLIEALPPRHGHIGAGHDDPAQIEQLKRLSETTRVPQAVYLREALDDLLKKYAATLRKAVK